MKEMEVYESSLHLNAIYNEYITGKDALHNQDQLLQSVEWFRGKDLLFEQSFASYAHQSCQDFIVHVKFGNISLYWDEIRARGILGIKTVGTDYGYCCQIVPQVIFMAVYGLFFIRIDTILS